MENKTKLPVKKEQKTIADSVLARVNEFEKLGEIRLPKDYNAGNALKAAWLTLQETKDREERLVLESCTKESIANALFEMVITGLSPMKKQCYFIAYGNKLTCQPSYNGIIALAKRYGGVKDVPTPNIIYEGDEFTYTIDSKTGRKNVVSHVQNFDDIDDEKIKGAYATLILEDDTSEIEIMNLNQIKKAWLQGAAKGNSPAHRSFPGEMAKKTVIYRACKIRINSSNDGVLGQSESLIDPAVEASEEEILKNANTEEVSFEEIEEQKRAENQTEERVEEKRNPDWAQGGNILKNNTVEEVEQQKTGPNF